MRRTGYFWGLVILIAVLSGCATTGSSPEEAGQSIPVDSIRDYICRVSINYHPSMDRFIKDRIRDSLNEGTEAGDEKARYYSYVRKGSTGSGFVYIDKSGNNYIITNCHVVSHAYTFTVTFEDSDNVPVAVFTNLTVFRADRENDLAILEFPAGTRPFKQGFVISGKEPRNHDEVIAAGYPGIGGGRPQWRESKGEITSAKHELEHKEIFILHSALTDPGNSGGPLLIADKDSPMGYSVIGVVNAKYTKAAADNLAIPANRVSRFIDDAFAEKELSEQEQLDPQIGAFIAALSTDSISSDDIIKFMSLAINDIIKFMSPAMLAENPDSTIETFTTYLNILGLTSSRFAQMKESVEKVIEEDPVSGIELATSMAKIVLPVAYVKKDGKEAKAVQAIRTEANNFGGYTVWLNVFGEPYRSEWVKSYGTWCIDDFQADDGEYNNVPENPTWHPLGLAVNYKFNTSRDIDWYEIDILKTGKMIVSTDGTLDTMVEIYSDSMRKLGGGDENKGKNNSNEEYTIDVSPGTYLIGVGCVTTGVTDGKYSLLVTLE
jgi:S1-C subfamily serine protease